MKQILFISLFLINFNLNADCISTPDGSTEHVPSDAGINKLVEQNCSATNADHRAIILNQQIKSGEDINSASMNLKMKALDEEIKALNPPQFEISILADLQSGILGGRLNTVYDNIDLNTRIYNRNGTLYRLDGINFYTTSSNDVRCSLEVYDTTNDISYGNANLFDWTEFATVTGGYTFGTGTGTSQNPKTEDICTYVHQVFNERLSGAGGINYNYNTIN